MVTRGATEDIGFINRLKTRDTKNKEYPSHGQGKTKVVTKTKAIGNKD